MTARLIAVSSGLGDGFAGGNEVRQHSPPAGVVASAQFGTLGAQPFPAAVFDLHPGRGSRKVDEHDLDVGGIGAVLTQVPQVAEAFGRLPGRDLSPLVDGPGGGPLEDATTDTALDDDVGGVAADGVVGRPPLGNPG